MAVSATLSHQEHSQFVKDVNNLDWSHLIVLSRDGDVTTVTPTNDDGNSFLEGSLSNGLLHFWGYDKKFKVPLET